MIDVSSLRVGQSSPYLLYCLSSFFLNVGKFDDDVTITYERSSLFFMSSLKDAKGTKKYKNIEIQVRTRFQFLND